MRMSLCPPSSPAIPQGDASVSYWKNVNDAYAVPTVDGLYRQSISSSSWTTRYANQNAKTWDPNTRYGISQVRVEDGADLNAAQIRDFLAAYTRYTYPICLQQQPGLPSGLLSGHQGCPDCCGERQGHRHLYLRWL